MRSLVACWKLLRALVHVARGWWTIRFAFPKLSPAERSACVEIWSRRMLEVMGIRLLVQGTPPAHGPVLVVCNPPVVARHPGGACRAPRALRVARGGGGTGRCSVRWPPAAARSTSSAERRRDTMRVVHHMAEALGAGDMVAVFPEGTTSDGHLLLPFHANLLQAAISAGAPVVPAALRFAHAATGETSFAPRYVGEDNLLTSVWSTLKAPPLIAIVRFGEAQPSAGRERRAWARELHADVHALIEATR